MASGIFIPVWGCGGHVSSPVPLISLGFSKKMEARGIFLKFPVVLKHELSIHSMGPDPHRNRKHL